MDDYSKILADMVDKVGKMQNSRYWSLWLIGLLFALASFINAIKWW